MLASHGPGGAAALSRPVDELLQVVGFDQLRDGDARTLNLGQLVAPALGGELDRPPELVVEVGRRSEVVV